MKKLISLILVVLMLGSVSVLAADITESVNVDYESETGSADAETQLWLQVLAEGQIDVTVPLILVCSTNVNGGKATPSDTYGITNNTNADLAVTKVTVAPEGTDMTAVAYDATAAAAALADADTYMAQLKFGAYTADLSTAAPAVGAGQFDLIPGANLVTVDMTTGPLTFVTGNNGVKLLTITYTVGLKAAQGAAAGTTIPTTAP